MAAKPESCLENVILKYRDGFAMTVQVDSTVAEKLQNADVSLDEILSTAASRGLIRNEDVLETSQELRTTSNSSLYQHGCNALSNVSSIEHTTDSLTNKNIWSSKAVHQLIDYYSEHQSKFSSVKYKKKYVWELIWQELVQTGHLDKNTKPGQVEQKWKNITKKYRDVVDRNSLPGMGKKTCPFYEHLHQVIGQRSISVESNEVTNEKVLTGQKRPSGSDEDSEMDENKDSRKIEETKIKKGRKQSTVDEILELMKAQTEAQAKLVEMMEKMHNDRMKMMGLLIEILKK